MSLSDLLRKIYCNDWENFQLTLTGTLMLSLQVYFTLNFCTDCVSWTGRKSRLMMFTQRSPEFILLFPADVHLKAFLLLNVMFQKCVFSCRRTALHMRYTMMRSLNQTLIGGKEDIPKVQGDSQAIIFFFLKLWITSTCLFVYLHI